VSALVALRLCATALVAGVVWQAPAQDAAPQPTFFGCPAQLAGPLRNTGLPVTRASVIVACSPRAAGDAGLRGVRVTVQDRRPYAGEPCADLDFNRVAFTVGGDGATARFAAFGGLSQGTLRVPPDQVAMIGVETAYVVDVQLGTYVEAVPHDSHGLVCGVDPTFHFDCPTTRELDRLCLVWFRDELEESDGTPPRWPDAASRPQLAAASSSAWPRTIAASTTAYSAASMMYPASDTRAAA
jgi:hypothetical protein